MSDLIRRQDAIDAFEKECTLNCTDRNGIYCGKIRTAILYEGVMKILNNIPSTEPNLIHCADCRWWKQDEDIAPYGWCFACKSGTYTEHWDIMIRRKYQGDFFCADAEPKIEGEDIEGEDDDE